uniref:Phospholipase-like protein n=1 Tax=Tanacetum cinerariifolium TaxID=118510 RepID=A0A6L2KH11_TANCI|nr:phospholipase-like protein [Tanacetum cinerariifolium]
MGKQDRNYIPRHLVTLVEDLDAWNDYHWGEYIWTKFYERTVNIVDEHRQHHLDEKRKTQTTMPHTIYMVLLGLSRYGSWRVTQILNNGGLKRIMSYLVVLPGQTLQSLINLITTVYLDLETFERRPPNDYAAENTKPNMIPNHSDDIPSCSILDLNSNQTGMDQELGGAANDPMLICSRPDMHNDEVDCDGMEIDKPDQMNDYNCSQPILASVDALIQACAYAADHLELEVLQHEAYVDRFGPKINQHPIAETLTEMIPNVSLDDIKFQHEEENLHAKDTPLEHQPIDELTDAQKDTTNLLP